LGGDVESAGGERRFKFKGGVPCLDFVNTLAWRLTDSPAEYLGSYEDLLAWAGQAGLLAPDETEALSRWSTKTSEDACDTLSRAIALREAIYRLFSATIASEPQDEHALSILNRELSEALSRLRVVPAVGVTYAWNWDRGGEEEGGLPLERALWPVAHSAGELLTSPKLGRVKVCAGEGCGWMFLDESRNASRRWCDSRDCGNRERVRKYLARKRASKS
jgi:predicted RNA-binding Zn ribbon-like protein